MTPHETKKKFASEIDVVTVIKVNYRTVEELFENVFRTTHKESFELPAIEERGSGDGYDWEVNIKKESLTEYDIKKLDRVKNGEWPMYSTITLLTECCNRGIIPEGKYLIDISW